MTRRRITLKIKGEAYDALMELSKVFGISPQELVEKLLIHHIKDLQDNALCIKEYFESSIVYSLELPFSFPYECELFEIQFEGQRRARIYLERIPKRYVYSGLPFRTRATIVVELTEEERQRIERDKLEARRIGEKYSFTAFRLLKNIIVGLRRITGIYYNIGVVEPPANLEEFKKRVEINVFMNGKLVDSYRVMPVKEDSIIVVGKHLDKETRSKILDYIAKSDILSSQWEYLDAAIISYYKEQWNLAILQSIIAMESSLSVLVFNTLYKNYFMKKYKSENELREKYRGALSLRNKIEKFLFPLLKYLGLNDIIREVRSIMSDINKLYELRSSIVHEGVMGDEENAKKAIVIAQKFLNLISSIIESRIIV